MSETQQEIETPQAGRSEYESKVYTPASPDELEEVLRIAADYRGDVTLQFQDQSEIEGFVYNANREADRVDLFVKEDKRTSVPQSVKFSEIRVIRFSGDDKAFGKSWEDWTTKSQAQKQAEAERLEHEAESRGHL